MSIWTVISLNVSVLVSKETKIRKTLNQISHSRHIARGQKGHEVYIE